MADQNSPVAGSAPYSVRRVNNVPLLIGFALAVAFILIVFLVILPAQNSGQNKTTAHVVDASDQARAINAGDPGGFVPARATPTPFPALSTPTPVPPTLTVATPTPTPDDRLATIQKALSFQTRAVNVEHPAPTVTPAGVPAATPMPEDYNGLLTRAQEAKGAIEGASLHGSIQQPSLNDYDSPNPARWHSPNTVENPVKYQLRAGFVIPAVLLSGVNSEIPGTIIAQVAQDVFDNATGTELLIPQGARLIGTYSANVHYGQSRLFVVWQRIVYPDGRALDIGAEPGTDSAGFAGFKDQVDSHWVQLFGSAIMLSAISAGVAYSQDRSEPVGTYYAPTFSQEMSQAVGQQFGTAAAQLLEKNLSVSPTLKIRPGYRFSVLLVKDFVFPGVYQDFAYPKPARK
jgi:type IV secretory pathway VirB10-like protein